MHNHRAKDLLRLEETLLSPAYLQKPFLPPLTSLISCNSSWALACLTSSHACTASLCSSQVTHCCFHPFLFVFELSQVLLVHQRRLPDVFASLPACQDGPLLSLEVIHAYQPASLLMALFHGTLPSRSLIRPKSAFLKSSTVLLLFALFPPSAI